MLGAAFTIGCHSNLPDPVEPFGRTPDAAFRKRAPEPLKAEPARLPPVRAERLANGLLVVLASRPNSPTTSVELVVRGAGSATDGEHSGLALGAAYALAEKGEAMFDVDVDSEATRLALHTTEAGFETAMRSLADAVLRPKIDRAELEAAQRYVAQRIDRERRRNLIVKLAYERLYARPPALLVAHGTSAFEMTKETVLGHYERFYGPETSALVIASPLSFERVIALAADHFGGWKPGTRKTPEPPSSLALLVPSIGQRPLIALDWEGDMAHALLILPGPPRGFPGFPEYLLADQLLGNSIVSRGNEALRLHDAKSYGVASTLERRRTESELSVWFSVEQDDMVESLVRILGELERLRREPVTTEELEAAKIGFQARLASRLVTSDGTVELLGDEFALDGDPAVLGEITESVERVKADDIQRVARREFTSDRTQVVVFLSRKRFEPALGHLGPVWWEEPDFALDSTMHLGKRLALIEAARPPP